MEGREAYTFASTYLEVEAVHVLTTNGIWRKVEPLDPAELNGLTPLEYFGGTSSGGTDTPQKGFPNYYDIQGSTIRLYPAPTSTAVTLTSGIRILFRRTVDLFTTSDTTQTPVIPSIFHYLIGYMASIPYCAKYHTNRVPWLEKKVLEGKTAILKFFAKRERDRRAIITMNEPNYL